MVRGPAAVRVKGRCRMLGMDVSGRQVMVRAGKALPFETGPDCVLGIDGPAWSADPQTAGTAMWRSVAQKLSGCSVVMVVGEVDAGKSTFCTYLANVAIGRGITPCVIDGDIGQGDLAPPAAMGAAAMAGPVTDLRDVDAGFFEFVGSISPAGRERLVARRMRSLLGRTRHLAGLHVINTDGYFDVGYKRMLARALKPDAMVVLGNSRHLAAELQGPWQTLQARSSRQAAKTYPERVGRRLEQFMHYVKEGSVSRATSDVKFVCAGQPALRAAEGMFVGLGEKGTVKGFGIIKSTGENITVKAGVRHFTTVWLSDVGLKDGIESRVS
jgi:polynucleotide 5'-hydroxyl-kinase GRC3/NOL9